MKISIDTSSLRRCSIKRCKRQPVYRHHKGCDNFIGKHNFQIARDYDLFLDCADVCDYHHMCIHGMYFPIIRTWSDYTPEGALRLRARLIAYCDKIIAGKVKLRKPSKKYKRQWRMRRNAWLKAKSSPNG